MDTSDEVEVSATPSQNDNFEIEVEAFATPYPHDIIIDRTYTNDDDGIAEDLDPSGSFPELTNYQLNRDRSRRSIIPTKRYSNSLLVSKFKCINLITYALFVSSKIDDSEPKSFYDAMNSSNAYDWIMTCLMN